MWSQYYHSTVSQLLLESLLKLCSENIPCEEKLEIDGIICISPGDVTKQIVVKVHEIVERGKQQRWRVPPEGSTGSWQSQDVNGEREIKFGEDQSELRQLITQRKELKQALCDNDNDKDDVDDDVSDVKEESPLPLLNSLLPSRQIVPFTKKKNKHRGRHQAAVRLANGHQQLASNGGYDYQISVDQPTVIEDQAGLNDQSSVVDLRQQSSKATKTSGLNDQPSGKSYSEESGRTIACRICHKYFEKYASLQAHNMEVHKRWTCKQCFSTFSMRCNLRRHERLHAGHKPHPCRICDKAFSRKGDLRIHEMKHGASGDVCNMICEVCNQFFSSKVLYERHECSGNPVKQEDLDEDSSSMQASDDMPNIDLASNVNQEDSNSSLGLSTQHTSSDANPSLSLLSDSLASGLASGGKVFTKVERSASPSQSLSYNDSDWGSFLTVPSPQRSHQVSPTPSAEASQDSNHISSNTGAGLTKASLNQSTSSNNTNSTNSSNNGPSLEPSEEKEFTCCLCKLQLYGFGSYDEHCQRQHLRFPCHLCDQTFTNRNNRSRHVRNHTGTKCYACEKCGKSFTRSDILREHQIIHTESYIGDTCTYCGLNIKKKAELLAHIKKCYRKRKSCVSLLDRSDLKTTKAARSPSTAKADNSQ